MANKVKQFNSTNSRYTRYVQGGETDRYPDRLGWWERRPLLSDPSDIGIILSAANDRRPDLVAAEHYNDARYAWVILQFNNIVDINLEFIAGRVIRFPSKQRLLLEVMTKGTGGKEIK